jgi:4-amino-4-deoxy-L-arabinose transferase-like glycosyltransferase
MNLNRRTLLVAVVIFAAVVFTRTWQTDLDAAPVGDEIEYQALAIQIRDHQRFSDERSNPTAWRTPGYPAFLAGVYALTGKDPKFGRIAGILVAGLTVAVLFWFNLLLFQKESIALAASFIWAFELNGIYLGGALLGESFAALLLLSACTLAISAVRLSTLSTVIAAFSGLLAGAAVLTRGYLFLVPATLVLYFLAASKKRKLAFVCLDFAALLPALWVARNAVTLGTPTFSTESAQVIWHGNNRWSRGTWNGEWLASDSEQRRYLEQKYPGFFDRFSETDRSRIYLSEAVSDITADPGRILALTPRKVFFFLTPFSYMGFDWIYLACIPFAIAGVVILWRKKDRRALCLLAVPVICMGVVCTLTFGDPRFRHPVDFCFAVLCAVGLTTLARRIIPPKVI